MADKQASSGAALATDSAPRPGDFPLGSAASRAAARLQISRLKDSRRRVEFRHNVCLPDNDFDPMIPNATEWCDCGDMLLRFVYIPTKSEKSPTAPVPICPGCGTPYRKTDRVFSSLYEYQADCVAKHVSDWRR